ncbi:MAG: SIMPL domain-containing protein [Bdellovibrionaceae bacterium]|nr:SIMPL domain-containing protein [Pseudobdellovibrionaceae bacterium]
MKNIILICIAFSTLVGAKSMAEERLISVTSFAEKSVDPNMVSLNIEVWSKAANAKQAQGLNAGEFLKVKKILDSFKVKKEDVQTENYSLNPEYVYNQKTQQNTLAGFRALQTLRVTLRKTEDLGSFLDATVTSATKNESGVNVNTILWDTDKRPQLEVAALGDAVRNGRQKADELAKAANVTIKRVAGISHGASSSLPVPMMRGGLMKTMAYEASSAPTEAMPGQVRVRVDVTAQYEIQ